MVYSAIFIAIIPYNECQINKSSNGKQKDGGKGGQGGHRGGKNSGNRGRGRGKGYNYNKDDRWSYKNQSSRHDYDEERGYGSQGYYRDYYGDYRRDYYNDRDRYDRDDRYNRF